MTASDYSSNLKFSHIRSIYLEIRWTDLLICFSLLSWVEPTTQVIIFCEWGLTCSELVISLGQLPCCCCSRSTFPQENRWITTYKNLWSHMNPIQRPYGHVNDGYFQHGKRTMTLIRTGYPWHPFICPKSWCEILLVIDMNFRPSTGLMLTLRKIISWLWFVRSCSDPNIRITTTLRNWAYQRPSWRFRIYFITVPRNS